MTLTSIAKARKMVLSAVTPTGTERLPVADALDRFLATELRSRGDVPPFSASAMDGYAVEPGPAGRTLRVSGESRAGAPSAEPLRPGEAIRISTGAELPPGAGAVVRQEDIELQGQEIVLAAAVKEGENVRRAGEVMGAGELVLARGVRLGAFEQAAAIAAGAGELDVGLRPRLTILSTGDELREPGQPLGPGEIHDSNGPMLAALAARSGARVAPGGRLADDRAATEAGLAHALSQADVVIVAGGVSVGPHDHVKPALASLGVRELVWGIALQPGKPTWIGSHGNTMVFGLPGNPVSAAVTFALFVAPALAALQGSATPIPPSRNAILASPVRCNPAREQALRVRLELDGERLVAAPTGRQASHYVTSLLGADALAMIPAGQGTLSAGSPIVIEALPH